MSASILKTNLFWGRRSGSRDESIPKGCALPWGNVFKQQQWNKADGGHSGRQIKMTLTNTNKKWFR